MSNTSSTLSDKFSNQFLRHYLRNSMGLVSKGNIAALVMRLFDKPPEAPSQLSKGVAE